MTPLFVFLSPQCTQRASPGSRSNGRELEGAARVAPLMRSAGRSQSGHTALNPRQIVRNIGHEQYRRVRSASAGQRQDILSSCHREGACVCASVAAMTSLSRVSYNDPSRLFLSQSEYRTQDSVELNITNCSSYTKNKGAEMERQTDKTERAVDQLFTNDLLQGTRLPLSVLSLD